MRFIIMHKTIPYWEAGGVPSPELVAEVGEMVQELVREKRLLAGDGLRPSSEGARVTSRSGKRTVTAGPFQGENELPAGFTAVRAASLEEAVEMAGELSLALGDVEIDVRPFTEAWDIGVAPKPEAQRTRRYMLLRKATARSEGGEAIDLAAVTKKFGDKHLGTMTLAPSRRGRRYQRASDGTRVIDGPFAESKELIAGYVMISADSLDDACRFVPRYLEVVGTNEVDVREVMGAD